MIINCFFKSLIDFSFIKLMSYLYPKIVAEYWPLPYMAWGRKKQSKTRNNILSFFLPLHFTTHKHGRSSTTAVEVH